MSAPLRRRAPLAIAVVAALALQGCAVLGLVSGSTTSSAGPAVAVTASEVEVPPLDPSVDGYAAGRVEVTADDGTVAPVAVRIARTAGQRQHGLMEVSDLPDGTGMWFVYTGDSTGGFWMKDTRVPLDIAYVGADGRIVSIADAVPCQTDPCTVYPPDGPYRNVLEVPAGYLDRIGAGVGASVQLASS